MPIYEYLCYRCGSRSSVLIRGYGSASPAPCVRCGSSDVRKLVSRFAIAKSEESRFEELADPSKFGDVDENDPRSMARWARKMGQQMGEELGDDFDEVVEQMEAGEMPAETPGAEPVLE